jgi:riboflavin kinase/FMN adenylyltransferase
MPERTDARQAPLTLNALDALPADLAGGAVAVGNFDGVHRGHAGLLRRTIENARQRNTRAVVLTFDPHPRSYFRPAEPVFRLTPPAAKARLMAAIGIDGLVVCNFDQAFSERSAEDFIDTILAGRLKARSLTVGEDFRFGRGRSGTTAALAAAGERLGFDLDIVAPIRDGQGRRISSSEIRAALASGDIATANRLLGYRWFVTGTVVPGERRGRELGFPTANIRLPDDTKLRHGVYAVTFKRPDGGIHMAVASYGRRPQFDNGAPLLEIFVFDLSADLYGEEVVVTFFDWIRPETAFPAVEDLVAAMKNDTEQARLILSKAGAGTALDRALAALR